MAKTESCLLEPPEVKIWKEEKVFNVRGSLKMDVQPFVAFNLIADIKNAPKVFRDVISVDLEECGDHVLVTQHMGWKFLFLSGTYDIKLKCWQDFQNKTVRFQLAKAGFMRSFNGQWGVKPFMTKEGSYASEVNLQQQVQPALIPPGPLAGYVVGIMENQVRTVFRDLCTEATSVQHKLNEENNELVTATDEESSWKKTARV